MKSSAESRISGAFGAAQNAVAIRGKRALWTGSREPFAAVRDLADLLAQIAATDVSRRLAEDGARHDKKKGEETP